MENPEEGTFLTDDKDCTFQGERAGPTQAFLTSTTESYLQVTFIYIKNRVPIVGPVPALGEGL
jgi:hypothetical protein